MFNTKYIPNLFSSPDSKGNVRYCIYQNLNNSILSLKFTNIRQPMLKLKTHSGFHDLFLKYHTFWVYYIDFHNFLYIIFFISIFHSTRMNLRAMIYKILNLHVYVITKGIGWKDPLSWKWLQFWSNLIKISFQGRHFNHFCALL
jgi:hypothetical protein